MRQPAFLLILTLATTALPALADEKPAEQKEKLKQSQQIPVHETTGVPKSEYEAHMQRGMKEFSQQNFAVAGGLFKQAAALRKDDWQSRYFQGLCELYQGRHAEAEALGREALALQPNEARANVLLGLSLKMQGKLDDAVGAFTEAYKSRKDDPQLLEYLASTFFDLKKHDRALPFYFDAMKLIPETDKVQRAKMKYNIALCYSFMSYQDEAEKHIQEALALQPSNPDYKKLLGEIQVLKAGGDPSLNAPAPPKP